VPDPRLSSAVAVADRHASILSRALHDLEPSLPLTIDAIRRDDPDLIRVLDQFQSRFTKLQDHLGSRLFPAILDALGEDPRLPAIDRLSLLERFGFLEDSEAWSTWRAVRNRLAHDYPEAPESITAELTEAIEAARSLLAAWSRLRELASRHQKLQDAFEAPLI